MFRYTSRESINRVVRFSPARSLSDSTQSNFRPLVTNPPPAAPEERSFVWKLRGFLTWTVIPGFMAYQVFFADFGNSEHVFSPARRWLARQQARFYTLDPVEQEMAREDLNSVPSLNSREHQ